MERVSARKKRPVNKGKSVEKEKREREKEEKKSERRERKSKPGRINPDDLTMEPEVFYANENGIGMGVSIGTDDIGYKFIIKVEKRAKSLILSAIQLVWCLYCFFRIFYLSSFFSFSLSSSYPVGRLHLFSNFAFFCQFLFHSSLVFLGLPRPLHSLSLRRTFFLLEFRILRHLFFSMFSLSFLSLFLVHAYGEPPEALYSKYAWSTQWLSDTAPAGNVSSGTLSRFPLSPYLPLFWTSGGSGPDKLDAKLVADETLSYGGGDVTTLIIPLFIHLAVFILDRRYLSILHYIDFFEKSTMEMLYLVVTKVISGTPLLWLWTLVFMPGPSSSLPTDLTSIPSFFILFIMLGLVILPLLYYLYSSSRHLQGPVEFDSLSEGWMVDEIEVYGIDSKMAGAAASAFSGASGGSSASKGGPTAGKGATGSGASKKGAAGQKTPDGSQHAKRS